MNTLHASGPLSLLRRIAWGALVAGFCSGFVLSAAQQAWVVPLIVEAEALETQRGSGESDLKGAQDAATDNALSLTRTLHRLLGNTLLGVGFGLILVSAMSLVARREESRAGSGHGVTTGLLWGLGGYAAFTLAPSLGIPPQLPGMPHADVGARQIWWLSTAITTAFGLAVLAFARPRFKAVGLALLIAPHLLPPPFPSPGAFLLPPELPSRFSTAVLVTSGMFWATLGCVAGWINRRLHP